MPFFFVGPALLVSLSSPPGLGPSRVRGFFGLPRLFLFLFLFFSQPFGFFSQVGRPPLPGAPGAFGPGRFYSMMRFSGAGQGFAAPFALNGAAGCALGARAFLPGAPAAGRRAPFFAFPFVLFLLLFFFYFCVWLFCLGALAPACALFALVFVLLFLIAFFFFFSFFRFFLFFFFLFFLRFPLARAWFAGRAFVSRRAPVRPLGVGRGMFSLGRRRRLGFGAGRVRSCASITLSGFSTPG